MGAGGQCLTPATCPWERELVPVLQEDEWAKCIKSGTTRTRSPDRPARGQSLYRLSHPSPLSKHKYIKFSMKVILEVVVNLRTVC